MIRAPVLHRRAHLLRGSAAGGGPAPAATRDQLVLADPHLQLGQVEHLAALQAHLRSAAQVRPAPRTRPGSCRTHSFGSPHLDQRRPGMALLPARLAPPLRRSERGAGLANGESDDGGCDEF